ncbi:MAG: SMC-Scp complex subunit ScpB [Bacteroidia bacterium]|nr:SMC-Scp complex subunit ScpB [Bacteroidia bacterium]
MELPITSVIEALVFASEQPVSPESLRDTLASAAEPEPGEAPAAAVTLEQVREALDALAAKYAAGYAFELRQIAGGYQFFTRPEYHPWVRRAIAQKNQKRLSRAALEVLSIVAYRQPVTKAEMEFIRGVNCDHALQKLLDRSLVSIAGRSDAPGRPLLYETSAMFMQYFGLRDLSDLPKLKEFEELAEDHLELFRQQQESQSPPEPHVES